MYYVKQFNINGVDTKQVGCIELHGKPNAATEGAVGVLGIDVDSPLHDVYKCVAVNGSFYSWELLSSGLSIMSASITGGGEESVRFPYTNLKTPEFYVVKVGDLILDREGYLYQIGALNAAYCMATYCGTQVVAYGKSAYALAVENGFEGSEEEWLASLKGEPGEQGEQGEQGVVDYNVVYPIGSLYLSTENVSPASFIGGTWEQIKDRFLLAAGDTYTAGATGGSADAIVVEHTHNTRGADVTIGSNQTGTMRSYRIPMVSTNANNPNTWSTDSTGSSGKGANLPPYLTVYMWKRVA